MKMKTRKFGRRFAPLYMADGDGDGGGGGDGGTTTFTQADLDTAVASGVATAISGLQSKNAELLSSLATTKDGLKAWDGLEADKVRDMMNRLENDEVLKLHAEGKHNEAYDKRMEKERATHTSALENLQTKLDTELNSNSKITEQYRSLLIDQTVTNAFRQEQGLESGITDVVLRAKAALLSRRDCQSLGMRMVRLFAVRVALSRFPSGSSS